ncbi:MAG: hypothetical protein ACLFQ8_03635 [Candidatus Aenigmatarchaeota archaeon]
MNNIKTPEEKGNLSKDTLIELYKERGMTQGEVADKFGVSQPLISRKLKGFGIETRSHDKWTDEEEEILKENYLKAGKEKMLELLPKRNWEAIKLKAMKLGVARSAAEYNKSEEVVERLRKFAKKNTNELKFNKKKEMAYVLGVIDGDGFHDKKSTIGLEVKSSDFADKFSKYLGKIGLNPGRGKRSGRDRETVWASSKKLIEWVENFTREDKKQWLLQSEEIAWKYIEGRYESDGNIHPSGSPRICSYDEKSIEFLADVLGKLGVKCNEQQNNVWVSKSNVDVFFENINPVIRNRR